MTTQQIETGFVYLIGVVDGCHKIGRSKDPDGRLLAWPILPVELTVRHRIATGRPQWLERYLHVAYKHRHVRGEWFRLDDEEIALIKSIPAADSEGDLPPAVIALYRSQRLTVMQAPSSRDTVPGFAAAIRARREALGLSLSEVADRSGTHGTSLSKLENGLRSPSLRLALALAEALEWTIGELCVAAAAEAKPKPKKK